MDKCKHCTDGCIHLISREVPGTLHDNGFMRLVKYQEICLLKKNTLVSISMNAMKQMSCKKVLMT